MQRTSKVNCPACNETGSFVEEFAETVEADMPMGSGTYDRPDYDTQLMRCKNDDCDVHRFLPADEEVHNPLEEEVTENA